MEKQSGREPAAQTVEAQEADNSGWRGGRRTWKNITHKFLLSSSWSLLQKRSTAPRSLRFSKNRREWRKNPV